MDPNRQKEEFSRAHVQAVAACAGFAHSTPSVDDDSVDMALHQAGGGGTIRSPRQDLQLKCTAAAMPASDVFPFSIKIRNHDDLREARVLVPRILVVVIVPPDPAEWLVHGPEELVSRRCAFWIGLRGRAPSEHETTQSAPLSRARPFTVQSLRSMMDRIGKGGLP